MKAELLSSIRWNILSFPIRAFLGLALSALIVRLLSITEVGLPTYAFATSLIATAITWASLGMPTILTRELSRLLEQKQTETAARLFWHTVFLRVPVSLIIGITCLALSIFIAPPSEKITFTITLATVILARIWLEDFGALSASFMNAAYDRAGSNLSIIVQNSINILLVGVLWLYGASSPTEILLAGAIALVARSIYTQERIYLLTRRTLLDAARTGMRQALALWGASKLQCAWAYLDKATNYFLSPSFIILLLSTAGITNTLGSIFLVYEFSTRVIGIIAVPMGGIVLPFLSRSETTLNTGDQLRIGSKMMRLLVLLATLLSVLWMMAGEFLFSALYGNQRSSLALLATVVTSLAIIEVLLHNGLSAISVARSFPQDLVSARAGAATLFITLIGVFRGDETWVIYSLAGCRITVPAILWILTLRRGTLQFAFIPVVILMLTWLAALIALHGAAPTKGWEHFLLLLGIGGTSLGGAIIAYFIFARQDLSSLTLFTRQMIRR